ncbi:MAG: hypothetical protein AAB403_10255 [Planctomycetota bacterium]
MPQPLAAVVLPVVDFPIDDSRLPAIVPDLGGGQILSVPRTGQGPSGWCYQNVKERCQRIGGRAEQGWMVRWLPEIFIEAMHHSVWRMPNGALLDVTAPQPGAAPARGQTTFMIEEFAVSFLREPYLTNMHWLLVDDPVLEEGFEIYRTNHGALRELSGLRLKDVEMLKHIGHPLPETEVSSYIEARTATLSATANETYRLLQEHHARLVTKYGLN